MALANLLWIILRCVHNFIMLFICVVFVGSSNNFFCTLVRVHCCYRHQERIPQNHPMCTHLSYKLNNGFCKSFHLLLLIFTLSHFHSFPKTSYVHSLFSQTLSLLYSIALCECEFKNARRFLILYVQKCWIDIDR